MTKGRLEAFSDAVIAIIMTIMVLELHPPVTAALSGLQHEWPVIVAYIISFIYLAIYWNNHHHMLHSTRRVDGRVLWANMHLLFWLSMVPFGTAWAGKFPLAPGPTFLYGLLLFMSGFAYYILERALVRANGKHSDFAQALGRSRKDIASVVLYGIAMALAFVWPLGSLLIYAGVAVMWLIPDPRFEVKGEV